MNPKDIAVICLNNSDFRFNAVLNWTKSFQHYWNINEYLDFKDYTSDKLIQTTCLLVASQNSKSYFVEELLRLGASVRLLDTNGEHPLHKAVQSQIEPLEKASILIAYAPKLLNSRNRNGISPLHYTAKVATPELAKLFIEHQFVDVNVRTKQLLTPLHVAAHFGNVPVVKILLTHADINVNAADYNGDTPAHHSAHYNHLEIYSTLRKHNSYDPLVRNVHGLTAEEELFQKLLDACLSGSGTLVETYVESCGVPLRMAHVGTTALHQSCRSNIDALHKVRFLIEKEPSLINQRILKCNSQATHLAAENKDYRVLKELANHFDTDMNSKNRKQMTPLHITSSLGYTDHVKLLLKKAIDINILEGNKNTPLHLACRNGHLDTIFVLKSDSCCRMDIRNLDSKVPDDLTPYTVRIHELAQQGFDHELKTIIDRSVPLGCDTFNNSALHYLCKSDRDIEHKAQMLIECDESQLFQLNNAGLMPLHLSIMLENIPLSVFLVRNYGRDFQTSDGRFPLHIAAQYDKTNIAQLLLEISNYDEVNAKDLNGNTAAHLASLNESDDTLKAIQDDPKYNKHILNNEGAMVDEVNPKNIALIRFCKFGPVTSVASLLQERHTLLCDSDGNNLLYVAYKSNTDRYEKCKSLLEHHPSLVNQQNARGDTLLHVSVMDGDLEFIELLVAHKETDINAMNSRDMTPVHCAIDRSNSQLVNFFLKHGVDINITNELGRACLHTCVVGNQMDILKDLLAVKSIEINTKDKFGRSPFQLAIDGRHHVAAWHIAFHPTFVRASHDPELFQALLNHGKVTDLTDKGWHQTRTVDIDTFSMFPSLDLVQGHIWYSGFGGVIVYDREMHQVAKYNTDVHTSDALGRIGRCYQVAELDNGQIVAAVWNGLYLITHTGEITLQVRGSFTSVQIHNGLVYAGRRSHELDCSHVQVYKISALSWELQREFRLPCNGAHFITLCVDDVHIHAGCWMESLFYTCSHGGILAPTHGQNDGSSNSNACGLDGPFLCHSDTTEDAMLVADYFNSRLQVLRRGGQWQGTSVTLPQHVKPWRAVYTPNRLYLLGVDYNNERHVIYIYEPTLET